MGIPGVSRTQRRRRVAVVALVMATVVPGAAMAAASDFDHPASHDPAQQFAAGSVQRQDTPDDPGYDQAEPDTQQPPAVRSTNLFDERFDLFGFPSAHTIGTAIYKDGPNAGKPMVSGFNAAGAWKLERGRPDVTIAILDTGIRWSRRSLRRRIRLNTGELPHPEHADGSSCDAYDCSGDGTVDVEDYAHDPRVSLSYPGREGPAGLVTGQDLIHAFGDCRIDAATHLASACGAGQAVDNDHNGYANDIAGWNFFDNTNDPTDRSSYFAASNHGSGRASDAAEEGDDGDGSLGVCPRCRILPIRVWDTFVSDGNTFGLAMTYATDNGVQVIEGADGSLYHSAFAEHASQWAYDHDVVQAYSGDDLNTANHNYPANYGHAMLIQGTVPDTVGLGQDLGRPPSGTPQPMVDEFDAIVAAATGAGLGTNLPVGTYFRGAGTTQYGGKSSISMEGATGSSNTGKAAGAAGLVVSAALDHQPDPIALRADETREILEQTAERVTEGNTVGTGNADPGADPTKPADEQWTTHFGWGRANLGAAVAVAQSGKIPPEAAIDGPDWYAPVTGAALDVTGRARARFAAGGAFHYKLMWGVGLAPTSWTTVREGDGSGERTDFGAIDLAAVRAALASPANAAAPLDPGGPVFAPTSNPFRQQFTVQLEVTAAGIPTPGIDRRVFTALDDPTLKPGFPKRLGTGGEAPIRYADLNGDDIAELIVPTEDGLVHAYERDGSELAGWPVHTLTQSAAEGHGASPALSALDAPREPPRGPVIADLDGSGRPDVITVAGIHVYAWHGDGTPVAGFPVASQASFCGPSHESQPLHHPKCGFLATPAIAHLQGAGHPPAIVAPSLDGHLYAFGPDGAPVPGYPRALVDPAIPAAEQMIAESINEPAVGDLNGDGKDDVVVATNEVYGAPAGSNDISFSGALASAAGGSTRVYAIDGPTAHLLPGWPIAVPGIIQNVLPFIGPGHDPSIVEVNGAKQVVVSATGGSLAEVGADGSPTTTLQQNVYGPASNAKADGGSLNLFESASIGDLLGTGSPDVVKYQVSISQAANLLLVGQNQPYHHEIGAFDAASGAPLPSFPTVTDDYQFLSSSDIAQVDPSGPTSQVLAGTGLGLLHAYDGATGLDAPGFPKQTGGWLFAPAAVSADGRLADITREGYLFEWSTDAPACQPAGQWPAFRHDPQSSGNADHDGTAPGAPRGAALTGLGGDRFRLTFTSPGDDGRCGTAAAYVTRVDGATADLGLGAPVAGDGAFTHDVTLPAGARTLTVQARDAAGNLGFPIDLAVPAAGATTGTPDAGNGGATADGSGSPASGASGPASPAHPSGPAAPVTTTSTASALGLPSARACVSRRTLTIHLAAPRGQRLRSARVYLNGHRVRVVGRQRLRAAIDLRGLKRGTFTVRIVARTTRGRIVTAHRSYRTCAKRRTA
jgi:hypothetical protein